MRANFLPISTAVMLLAYYFTLSTISTRAADGIATKAISGSAFNSVVLRADGTAWAWGLDLHGECGNSIKASASAIITNAALLSSTVSNFVAISAGGGVSGEVYINGVPIAD